MKLIPFTHILSAFTFTHTLTSHLIKPTPSFPTPTNLRPLQQQPSSPDESLSHQYQQPTRRQLTPPSVETVNHEGTSNSSAAYPKPKARCSFPTSPPSPPFTMPHSAIILLCCWVLEGGSVAVWGGYGLGSGVIGFGVGGACLLGGFGWVVKVGYL